MFYSEKFKFMLFIEEIYVIFSAKTTNESSDILLHLFNN